MAYKPSRKVVCRCSGRERPASGQVRHTGFQVSLDGHDQPKLDLRFDHVRVVYHQIQFCLIR